TGRLHTIEGTVPTPTELPLGCHFAPRCEFRLDRCTHGVIPFFSAGGDSQVRCVLYDDEMEAMPS
ncbi:MAG: ABC transporter ATP-binding protein, partial [Acidobacteria bacterium]|nr:ABC transporter ATP-binding protein [Acidobacteriota bacterium]